MVDEINYNDDFPRFDQYFDYDDDFQTEANFAKNSVFDFWEEAQFHKIGRAHV